MGVYLDPAADLPLFAPRSPLVRTSDRATSHAAADAASEFEHEHERLILEALAAGPGTKDEIAARCGLMEQQVIRRMAQLERTGRVADTGMTRPTASRRNATVWQAKESANG